MEQRLNKLQVFFKQSPEWIYLITGVVFFVLFVEIVRNKNWAISPSSGNQRFFYNTFGRKNFRIVIGTVYLFTSIIGIGGFLLYYFN